MIDDLAVAVIEQAITDWVKGRKYLTTYTPKSKSSYFVYREKFHDLISAYKFLTSDNMYWQYTQLPRKKIAKHLNVTPLERKFYEEVFKLKRHNYYTVYEQRQVNAH